MQGDWAGLWMAQRGAGGGGQNLYFCENVRRVIGCDRLTEIDVRLEKTVHKNTGRKCGSKEL